MQEPLLSLSEVAKRLSKSERWVAEMCRTQQLVAVKLGKSWRVSEVELEKFIQRRKNAYETA